MGTAQRMVMTMGTAMADFLLRHGKEAQPTRQSRNGAARGDPWIALRPLTARNDSCVRGAR